MTKWWRKLRRRHVWYVIVVAYRGDKAQDPTHVGPFYSKASATDYRNKWDNQFKGFAVVDRRPLAEPVADVLALNWKLG